jgi:hypothetical protein
MGGILEFAVEMGSGAMIYNPSFGHSKAVRREYKNTA